MGSVLMYTIVPDYDIRNNMVGVAVFALLDGGQSSVVGTREVAPFDQPHEVGAWLMRHIAEFEKATRLK